MFLDVLMIILFVLPGLLSELYYLKLINRSFADDRLVSIVRAISFSMVILLVRCVIAWSKGYGGLSVQELFLGIGNAGKYILLSAALSVLMPNAYFPVEKLLSQKRK